MINKKLLPAYIAFICVCFFWGTTFFAIRIGIRTFPASLFAGLRHTAAGIILCTFFIIKKEKLPSLKELLPIILTGILMLAIANGLITWAEIAVPSGIAALLCAGIPLWVTLINLVLRNKQKINLLIILGLIMGLAGLIIIFYDSISEFSNPAYLSGILVIICANISWAIGTVISKNNHSKVNPLFSAGIQMLFSGIFLDILALSINPIHASYFQTNEVLSLIYLIVFGSIVGYGSYIYALSKLPATLVTTYAYVNPIVAVFAGALYLGEQLTLGMIISMAVTIAGVYLVNRGYNNHLKFSKK